MLPTELLGKRFLGQSGIVTLLMCTCQEKIVKKKIAEGLRLGSSISNSRGFCCFGLSRAIFLC